MTKLMLEAIAALRRLPNDQQDDVATAGRQEAVFILTPEKEADLDEADREVERGDVLTDEELKAIWAKHGL